MDANGTHAHGALRLCERGALGLVGVLLFSPVLCAQRAAPTEYQLKAAYLYNFGLFVSWPASRQSHAAPFGVCVLGKDPFGANLDSAFSGERLDGRRILIRRIADPGDAAGCSILYISRSESKRLGSILTALGTEGILTVSDIPDFSQRGGMIQFVWLGDKVRFEVNLAAAQAAGLALSSDLLKLAVSVRRDTPSGI